MIGLGSMLFKGMGKDPGLVVVKIGGSAITDKQGIEILKPEQLGATPNSPSVPPGKGKKT